MAEFAKAALPWVLIGLAVAILCARGAAAKKKGKRQADYSVEGMCLGMSLGTALDSTGLGSSLGMLIGMAVGMLFEKPEKEERE